MSSVLGTEASSGKAHRGAIISPLTVALKQLVERQIAFLLQNIAQHAASPDTGPVEG